MSPPQQPTYQALLSPAGSPRAANPAPTMTPPPCGYTQASTELSYTPLTPPYRYEQTSSSNSECSPPHQGTSPPPNYQWTSSTPPPYHSPVGLTDFSGNYSELQVVPERKYSEILESQRLQNLDELESNAYLNDESAFEQLRAICLQQAASDVKLACQLLNISPNPYSWSMHDVQKWILWLIKEQSLDCSSGQLQVFYKINGSQLVSLCESQSKLMQGSQSSQLGQYHKVVEMISAHLEIWKSAAQSVDLPQDMAYPNPLSTATAYQPYQYYQNMDKKMYPNQTKLEANNTDDSLSDDEDTSPVSMTTGQSTQHIHLWQFLKELLSDPQQHGSCIRWLDRARGIFKIEDSVRVARLWGRRKNRPAMNYDKLSRSIRQYYRKGIMKKTERSQRLVYQFCPAYAN